MNVLFVDIQSYPATGVMESRREKMFKIGRTFGSPADTISFEGMGWVFEHIKGYIDQKYSELGLHPDKKSNLSKTHRRKFRTVLKTLLVFSRPWGPNLSIVFGSDLFLTKSTGGRLVVSTSPLRTLTSPTGANWIAPDHPALSWT